MVRFFLSALAVIASATLITATPVGPRQEQQTGVLPNLQFPPDRNAPNSDPLPQPPAPLPAAGPDRTGADASDANPFSAGSDDGGKSTAENVAEALTGP
ncbi:hypothetical protein FSARC_9507 [Fusarium sarcochroum]|uniref:Uncharacterized protein n=1 Tax=Fusarium sarcochroum TaxID=1208366 RepID=A0A8H4TQQ6_9HYPO|nr:hypothetical protein FSARC_9507 [Fusarium sarcochroum]